ncbi:MAG: carbohydrate ABC transporter substrate-binding protein [Spirochaetes bacterium]|uniref:Carbohydrate ABC transporter substrate-binding protein n=1 Tax=Candidatus Ornithospirochaeta stercoripullorum TaxID=2840899 RepID=A0A9D9DZ12_9SPIO|nr:carbohydrate ABC transporter substrate-binding protein [Candidatus Ornithospirochaeta stercoripullorum]
MKRGLITIALALLAVSMVFAGGSAEADDGQKTITVWAWDDNFNVAVMKEAAEVYAQVNPDSGVTIDVESFSKEDVFVKLQTGLAGGGTAGLPDIVLLEDYVAGKYLTTFPGSFVDLTDLFDFSQFLQFKVDAVSQDGKVYGLPFDTGAAALYYRLDLIEEAGYTEEDMQNLTWDEFIAIGKDVLEKTGIPMIVEIANNKTTLVRAIMQSCGEWYFDKNGDISITNNASLRAAMEILLEMRDAGILFEAESTEGRAAALNNGRVASVVNAPWFISSLRPAEDQSGLWRATRIPRIADIPESINASNVGGSSWYVLANSDVKDEAIEFLQTVWQGNTDFYDTIMLNQGAMGSYIPGYSTSVYDAEDPFFGGQKINALFAEILPEVIPVNYGGYVAEANDAITTALANLFAGRTDVDGALAQADAQLHNQLGR